ncbi:MAG: sigma-54-dependent Fis family transcriptional regulator [Deltaproteobacteria bacterium]|nr:sigma-54-dependent Fis family transcriptional regulator [Deltaproteobacteria bacterium]
MERTYDILVIDDDAFMRDACHQALSRKGHTTALAKSGREGLALLEESAYDLVLLDLNLPREDGLFILAKIKDIDPDAVVVMISGRGSIETAVQAIKLGAFDFIAKPFTPEELINLVYRALRNRRATRVGKGRRRYAVRRSKPVKIISQSAAMERVKEMVEMVAPTDSTVLLEGPSGTGKGLVARKLHELSPRRSRPFVAVDCGSLVKTLFESELFGHVKGAFTGADSTQQGKFEMARGGTLFFDEISNINLEIQAKLLKAVEEKRISKVGDHKVVDVDVRIISATNGNLKKAISKGLFREDLFFRLNVVSIHLPPLRERGEDIPLLAEHFLRISCNEQGKSIEGFSPNAMKALCQYTWPGNVRELENTVERLVVFAQEDVISTRDLVYSNTVLSRIVDSEPIRLEEMEREHITKVLASVNGNKTQAAQLLGIDRKTLRIKVKKYGIEETSAA